MIVMPSNHYSEPLQTISDRFPGRIGSLLSPDGWRRPKFQYALDNGAFPAWTKGKPWDEEAFISMLEKASKVDAPRWVLVPDVVADREATLALWKQWGPALRDYGWPLAFAVQDGMTQADVPKDADVIFVGGSTAWKWRTVLDWGRNNARVHVGRVNGYEPLWGCHFAGAESCDGTGWFRGDLDQLAGLERYLAESTNGGRAQSRLIA